MFCFVVASSLKMANMVFLLYLVQLDVFQYGRISPDI